MKTSKYLITSLFTLMLGSSSVYVMADVDAEDFVEEASAKNIAEIEAGKLALEKSSEPAVRTFAQEMIKEHSAQNSELRGIATRKKVEMADDATLANQAKAALLKQYDGVSFDVAYANNQVSAHRDAIEYYQDATKSKDTEVRTLAVATLPTLHHHLRKAEALVSELAKNNEEVDNTAEHND